MAAHSRCGTSTSRRRWGASRRSPCATGVCARTPAPSWPGRCRTCLAEPPESTGEPRGPCGDRCPRRPRHGRARRRRRSDVGDRRPDRPPWRRRCGREAPRDRLAGCAHPPRRPRRRRARTPIGSAVTISLPAWSEAFAAGARDGLARTDPPFGRLDRQDVFGDADGQGVTVAIIDSGVDGDHPAVRGRVARHLRVDLDGDAGDGRRRSGGPRPRRARDRVRRHRGGHRPRSEPRVDPHARRRQPRQGASPRGRCRLDDRGGHRRS